MTLYFTEQPAESICSVFALRLFMVASHSLVLGGKPAATYEGLTRSTHVVAVAWQRFAFPHILESAFVLFMINCVFRDPWFFTSLAFFLLFVMDVLFVVVLALTMAMT